jgi:hypothetical protein
LINVVVSRLVNIIISISIFATRSINVYIFIFTGRRIEIAARGRTYVIIVVRHRTRINIVIGICVITGASAGRCVNISISHIPGVNVIVIIRHCTAVNVIVVNGGRTRVNIVVSINVGISIGISTINRRRIGANGIIIRIYGAGTG